MSHHLLFTVLMVFHAYQLSYINTLFVFNSRFWEVELAHNWQTQSTRRFTNLKQEESNMTATIIFGVIASIGVLAFQMTSYKKSLKA